MQKLITSNKRDWRVERFSPREGNIILQIYEKSKEGHLEPAMTATAPCDGLKEGEVAIKDYSENTGILDVLVKNGIVDPPHRFISAGYTVLKICMLLEEENTRVA